MGVRVLIGIAEPALAGECAALVDEGDDYTVAGRATATEDLRAALAGDRVDIVVLHDSLGPLPVLELARELAARFPHVGLVLLAREQSADLLRTAMQAGVRGVTALPLSLEALHAELATAAAWASAVRQRLSVDGEAAAEGPSARMIAVAGAKGGVGATTVAVHLALAAAAVQGQSVCLVDYDLQAGDVRALLDMSHRRSVTDLLEVAGDISARNLDEALYSHASGLRVLLPPRDGERAEEVGEWASRHILGAIRARFDLVIVDVGTVMTEGSAAAIEMADEVLLVVTPDVLALRAANRLVELWDRLHVRKDRIAAVLNRASRTVEVQADLVGKVVAAPLLPVSLPATFLELEPALNTTDPQRVDDGAFQRALLDLAERLGVARSPRRRRRLRRLRGTAGSVAVEAMGVIPVVLLVVALLWQLLLTGLTFVLAGHAAREGARALAVGEPVTRTVDDSLPAAWRAGRRVTTGPDWVEVDVRAPILFPGIDLGVRVPARVGAAVEPRVGVGGLP